MLGIVGGIARPFTWRVARDGREGLEASREHGDRIAVVLLDLTMTHLGGEEVYREKRRIRPDVPVLLSSGYDEQTVQHRLASEEFAGFIQKPYRTETLRARIGGVLRG